MHLCKVSSRFLPCALALTISHILGNGACAQSDQVSETERLRQLDQIEVSADPLRRSRDQLLQPVEVLNGAELDRRRANTLGETLDRELGVQNSFFGAGAGRPIIRGLEGARVQVLNDGIASQDVSTVSVDHAVTIDPFVAEQIEVIKGPAALLYGSGAIGGAVNVVDGRIPTEAPDGGASGRVQLYGDTVADTVGGAARLDAGNGPLLFHADAFYRDSDDYEIPGFASAEQDHDEEHDDERGHDEEEEIAGLVENSALETKGGSVGVSYVGDQGYIGIAVSGFDTFYGVPGHSHEEHALPRLALAKDGDDEEEEAPVRLEMDQTRWDIAAGLLTDMAAFSKLRLRMGYTEYEHTELEGEEIGTEFDNKQIDWRVEAEHAAIGAWRGVYGFTYSDRDFSAVGEEAFVPPNTTDNWALFLVETGAFGAWKLEAGLRYESQDTAVDDGRSADHDAISFSLAGRYSFDDNWSGLIRFDRAQRAPTAEELYSEGPHIATATFEIGDPNLDEETTQQFELGVHFDNDLFHAEINAFYNDFKDFIYLADTGLEEDELPVRQWTQADARFQGIEALLRYHLGETRFGHFDLTGRTDYVHGRLRDGGDLPRIAPGRVAFGLDWNRQSWSGGLELMRVSEQDHTAEFEDETEGYTLIGADLAYSFTWGRQNVELFLQGRNLTDRQARVHTSLVKDRAPLPGRNLVFGVRSFF